jgi:DNA modification methylase
LAWSPARANYIHALPMQNVCKPIVLLRKGEPRLLSAIHDLVADQWSGTRADQLHKWQQPLAWAQKLIRAMTMPRGLVADPMCGSGTTGAAALTAGRRFVGCDRDPAAAITARARLRKLAPEPRLATDIGPRLVLRRPTR